MRPVFLAVRSPLQVTSTHLLGARVVAKGYPKEKVGVFVVSNGKHRVVEYSELPLELAQARIPNSNQLVFIWGNICMHYFTLPFLYKSAKDLSLQYHVAKKHIPSQGSSIEVKFVLLQSLRLMFRG